MTLIKYYTANTCYDGEKEFIKTNNHVPSRFYPDEYLIVDILKKYLKQRFPISKNVMILAEPWQGSVGQSSTRSGGKNTFQINEIIIEKIKLLEKKNEKALILVPFLYGYHHPGITIDVEHKTAIYLDPYGSQAHYPEAKALQKSLTEIGFKSLTVTTKQQTDAVSCGPILTASMIKFMEEFMALDHISVDGFKAPRVNLATERLFQMYINNTVDFSEDQYFFDEIMLADEELWAKVLQEQKISDIITQKVLAAVRKQRDFIVSLPNDWAANPLEWSAVEFIKNFQSKLTELIFLRKNDLESQFQPLIDFNNLFEAEPLEINDNHLNLLKQHDLLNKNHIDQTHAILGLIKYEPKNNLPKLLKESQISSIKKALDALENKIKQINHYHLPAARKKAIELLDQLTIYQEIYKEALLKQPYNQSLQTAGRQFHRDCQEAIAQARPILERDLDWGDYLTNLLKTLINAVMQTITLGLVSPNSLFVHKKAELIEAVEEAESNLKPDLS